MSSTRNKNTPCNYAIERTKNADITQYSGLPEFARAYRPCHASNGLLPAKMHHTELDNNGVDVESFLYGIRATNLAGPSHIATPDTKTLPWMCVYSTRKVPFLPAPINITGNERYEPS